MRASSATAPRIDAPPARRPEAAVTVGAPATMAVAAGVGLIAALLAGCFSLKEPPCAFSCADPPHACPAHYACMTDGLCHKEGTTLACFLTSPTDAGIELGAITDDDAAPAADASPDGAGAD